MSETKIGSVAVSLKGDDCGRVMLIVGFSEGFALVADGRKRRLEKPKRKNLCHLRVLSDEDACLAVNAELTNKKLWKALEPFRFSIQDEFQNKK